jgi:hypothetical protein
MRFSLWIIVFVFFYSTENLIAQDTTYYGSIQSIINKKCVSCHKANGYAPFDLSNYDDVKQRASFIKYVVQNRIMPPWKANNNYRDFADDKSLNDDEIALIVKWVDRGCMKGRGDINSVPIASLSDVNKPDLVLTMLDTFSVPGNNKNTYICYKIPFEINHDTFVKAVEFFPGNKSVVHHASYQILEVADDVDVFKGPYYFMYDADTLNRVNDKYDYKYLHLIGNHGELPVELYHNGWLPGSSLQKYPSDIGFRLPKKGVLLIRNFHYSPTPIIQKDLSGFNIYYSSTSPSRKIGFAAFKPKNPKPDGKWVIEAGDSNFKSVINIRFHNDVSLLNINPHMHRLGRYFKAYAITPNQDTIKLVEILNWDFNWQEFYRFRHMLKIPAGSILHAEAIYDNSANNPENPNNPPKDILFEWGMNDDSEMMRLVLLYLPYKKGDENISLEH